MIDKKPNSFRKITDLTQYVEAGLSSGAFTAQTYAKTARIRAVPGTPGERIETILKNGLKETENTVGADPETGVPDWIVTGQDGERYIVTDAVFREKYTPDPDEPGVFVPRGKPVLVVQVHESIRFTAPWGEEQLLAEGGYLILAGEEIYGVEKDVFEKTYRTAAV